MGRARRILPLAIASLCVPAAIGRADDPPKPAQADRATELMRREAAAAAAARLHALQKLEAMPPAGPPDVVDEVALARRMLIGGIRVARVHAAPMGGALILRRDVRDHDVAPGDEPRFVVDEGSFDQFLFGTAGAESAHAYFAARLERRVVEAAQAYRLTPSQCEKLQLAGRGDIKRLFDRVEEARATFRSLRSDVDRCVEYLADLAPLWSEIRRGPFGPDCLLEKTLRTLRAREAAAAGPPR